MGGRDCYGPHRIRANHEVQGQATSCDREDPVVVPRMASDLSFFRANGFEDVAHIVHYRKSWKMDLLHAIVTRLPKRMADRLADRVRRIPGAKETIFGHDWRDEYVYPDSAWRDRHAFYPHPQTRSMYIGMTIVPGFYTNTTEIK